MFKSAFYSTFKRNQKWNVLEKLNWLSVHERREIFTCEYVYKHVIKKTALTRTLEQYYQRAQTTRERRKPLNFLQPQSRTKWAKSNFIHQSIQVWNNIPNEIQNIKSIDEFSRQLRKHIIQQRNDIYIYT